MRRRQVLRTCSPTRSVAQRPAAPDQDNPGGRRRLDGPLWAWMARHPGMDVHDGAMPLIRAATDPQARGGEFYGPRFVNLSHAVRLPLLRPGADEAIRGSGTSPNARPASRSPIEPA